jgi:predicted GIY-YIG superfamily endonuclease
MTNVVYVLQSVPKPNSVYVGFSNNLKQRLRKHNGVIKGGAKKTKRDSFRPWKLVMFVTAAGNENEPVGGGWFDHTEALKLEWALQHTQNKPIQFRIRGEPGFTKKLNDLLWILENKPRWTSKSCKSDPTKKLRLHVLQHANDIRPLAEKCRFWPCSVQSLDEEYGDVLNEFKMKVQRPR